MGARAVRRAALALATLLASAAAVAGSAEARTTVTILPPGFAAYAEPISTLVGNEVIYYDYNSGSSSHPNYALRIVSANGVAKKLTEFPLGTNGFFFKGSPSQLVIARRYGPAPNSYAGAELTAGPPRGPRTTISTCALPVFGSHGRFDVDGDDVAYIEDDCNGGARRLVVRDLTAPAAASSIPVPADVDSVALAGPYVAYHSAASGEILEYDWRGGAEVLRTPDGGDGPCGAVSSQQPEATTFCALDVQSDGRMARLVDRFVFARVEGPHGGEDEVVFDTCKGHVDTIAPGESEWQQVVDHGCNREGVRIARDRILLQPTEYGPFTVAELDGSEHPQGAVQSLFGFDGDHVLTDQASCTSLAVVSQSVLGDDPPLEDPYSKHCPQRYSEPRVRLGSLPSFSVTVRCPRGCHGPIVVGAGDWLDGASREFVLPPGAHTRVRIPLSRFSEIVKRAKRKRRVTVSVYKFLVARFEEGRNPLEQVSINDPATHLTVRPARRAPRAASRSARARRASGRGRPRCRSRSGRCSSSR
jgi:hypothetical protein